MTIRAGQPAGDLMTGRTGEGRRGSLAFSLRGVAALAGCGGDSPDDGRDDDGRDRDSSRPDATESREEATEDRAARRETRQASSGATDEPAARRATRPASPGATDDPDATEAADGAMPPLGVVEVVEETEEEFASVSAGIEYTCGVRRDGAVVCWGGSQARGLTAADFE